MRLFLCVLLFLFPRLLWAGEGVEQSEAVSIDFLYINANAGEAAGGHTALRLGDSVFHYQFFPDSTFLLVRESWDSFRFLYNDLHNRSIAIASLPLELSVATRIRNHFTELLVAQGQFFNELERLQKEEQFVQMMLTGKSVIALPGLGFFTDKFPSHHQTGLAQQVETALGTGFLQRAAEDAEEALQEILSALNSGKRPESTESTLQEALALREALRVLVEGRALDTSACIGSMEGEGELGFAEKGRFQNFAEYLAQGIVELLQSARPDRGEALLIETARYLAVQHALATGELLTLDPFSEDVRVVQLTDEELAGAQLPLLQQSLLSQAVTRREVFFQEEQHLEIAYSLLETSRARAWELSRVNDTQRKVRILVKLGLPTRPAMVSLEGLQPPRESLLATAGLLEGELEEQRERSEELYGYNLFRRNCATELIRSLNGSFADSKSGRKALGGWLEADEGLVFIPFLFYEQAVASFSLQDKEFLQARRLRNLETLYDQESDLLVWLRESNTLSSTLYKPRSKDTPFLFFTDDSLLLRPILGVLNVGYAVVYGVAGAVAFPFDGGVRFQQAYRGVFYSLPELGFGNIRKGSYPVGEFETDH